MTDGTNVCRSAPTTPERTIAAQCLWNYPNGHPVDLTAGTIGSGWRFDQWGSGCTQFLGQVCRVTSSGPSVTATGYFDDVHPPEVTISGGPSGHTRARSARFDFRSDEADTEGSVYECAFDGAPLAGCESPRSVGDLPDGHHAFRVRARDPSGQWGPIASREWDVDNVSPAIVIADGPTGPTPSRTVTFRFLADDAERLDCALDGGAWSACDSTASHTYRGLAEGPHTIRVRGQDRAGNQTAEPAARAWAVDVTPPDTVVTSGPSEGSILTATNATLTYAADPAESGLRFDCDLDAHGFARCPDGVMSYDELRPGRHEFAVRAVDRAGNLDPSPARRVWTISALPDPDDDDDGHERPSDCDDGNAQIHPGASEILDNDVDEDCDGRKQINLDRDHDGFERPADCDDGNRTIHPGATDRPDNDVDENCDGRPETDPDRDDDGYNRPADCDDLAAGIQGPGPGPGPQGGSGGSGEVRRGGSSDGESWSSTH
ncbi:MAG: putative metal-binding motif-containing protein [Nocardioidaceae bacterium]